MIHGLHAVLTTVWHSDTFRFFLTGIGDPYLKMGKGPSRLQKLPRDNSVPGKVFAHLLLMRIPSHLLKYQRPEESGFTSGKSTTDRILALRVLVKRRLEFRQVMLIAYVNFKKVFDSVHCEVL